MLALEVLKHNYNMSYILSTLGLASVAYAIYKFTRKGTTAVPPLFRDPFLKPVDFDIDPVLSQAPQSAIPPAVLGQPPPPPSLLGDDYDFPVLLSKED